MFRYKNLFKELCCLAAGTILMAAAVNWIYEPLDMVTGGISGLAIVVKSVSYNIAGVAVPVWISNFVINIPIFIWGIFIKGKEFIAKTLFANSVFSTAMYIMPVLDSGRHDYLLAAVVGSPDYLPCKVGGRWYYSGGALGRPDVEFFNSNMEDLQDAFGGSAHVIDLSRSLSEVEMIVVWITAAGVPR